MTNGRPPCLQRFTTCWRETRASGQEVIRRSSPRRQRVPQTPRTRMDAVGALRRERPSAGRAEVNESGIGNAGPSRREPWQGTAAARGSTGVHSAWTWTCRSWFPPPTPRAPRPAGRSTTCTAAPVQAGPGIVTPAQQHLDWHLCPVLLGPGICHRTGGNRASGASHGARFTVKRPVGRRMNRGGPRADPLLGTTALTTPVALRPLGAPGLCLMSTRRRTP
jgi:hypothetical protein